MKPNCLISRDNMLIIKGVGILLMLIHHLFYNPDSRVLYDDIVFNIHGRELGLVHQMGIYGKLCVALFVFLSGYGLAIYTPKETFCLKDFYLRRFTKLYLNYWFIVLLFVPIGVFVFGRTLTDAYGSHVILKAVLEFFGILNMFGGLGYNPTWWFYSCIILLYLLYPLLNRSLTHHFLSIITTCVIISFGVTVPIIGPIAWYLLPFAAGIVVAKLPVEYFDRIKPIEAISCFILLSAIRNFSGNMIVIIDTLLCISLAVFVYHFKFNGLLKAVFVSLGKHSMNMFLFHTFIFYYWFRDETYYFRNPVIIFLQLVAVSYLLSVIIEFVKDKIGFYKLCNKIIQKK